MQLYFAIVGGGGGWLKLWDDGAVANDFDAAAQAPAGYPKFSPHFSGSMQEDELFTTPDPTGNTVVSMFRQPLSNVKCVCQVELWSAYKSRADSLASIRTFAALLQMKVHFKVVHTDGPTTETQYYPNAAVPDYQAYPSGLACVHTFTFHSDTVTAVNPGP